MRPMRTPSWSDHHTKAATTTHDAMDPYKAKDVRNVRASRSARPTDFNASAKGPRWKSLARRRCLPALAVRAGGRSVSSRYASAITLNRSAAAAASPGCLSGCSVAASRLYLARTSAGGALAGSPSASRAARTLGDCSSEGGGPTSQPWRRVQMKPLLQEIVPPDSVPVISASTILIVLPRMLPLAGLHICSSFHAVNEPPFWESSTTPPAESS
mmetsp:Transcript_65642/g.201124  ORF Transcript_65642/g.201124 Transcript_65642/m.201124 type:complete len:214 (-) Transcript_65642:29-670(-)